MANCFVCNNSLKTWEKRYSISEMGKYGILIPYGMTSKDRICHSCYSNNQTKITDDPSIQVGGIEVFDKILTQDEIKQIYERGPPKINTDGSQIIFHKDKNNEISRIDHLIQNTDILIELSRLLEMKFLQGENFYHPVVSVIREIDSYHVQKNEQQKILQISKIERWVKLLQTIESYDKKLLDGFRKTIQEATTEEFFGVIFEIGITSRLINEKVNFRKTESPDFTLSTDKTELFIECTSTHEIQKIKDIKKPIKKIRFAITAKSKKAYCHNKTALFMDITNLYFQNAHTEKNDFDKDNLKKYVKKYLQKSNFGNVTLFSYILDTEKNIQFHNFIRVDNTNIDSSLKNFLDKMYPVGNISINKPMFPSQP